MLECDVGRGRPARQSAGNSMRPDNDNNSALRRRLARALRTTAALAFAAALWPAQAWAVPVLTIDDMAFQEGSGGGYDLKFVTIRASEPAAAGGISFDVSTVDGTADGNDYQAISGFRAQIPEGQTEFALDIAVLGDIDIEPDETFQVTLSNPAGATLGDSDAVVTILNDDRLPVLSTYGAVAREGGELWFRIMLDAPARPGGVDFTIRTVDETAVEGVDYRFQPGRTLTIPEGEEQADFLGIALPDDVVEGEETFRIEISDIVGAVPGITSANGIITDVPVGPLPEITADSPQVMEGDSGLTPMVFHVSLDAASQNTVAVDYQAPGGSHTNAPVLGRLIFLPGETGKEIVVPVYGDTIVEPDQDVLVYLFGAVNAHLAQDVARGTVINDDARIDMVFSGSAQGRVGSYYNAAIYTSGATDPYQLAVTVGSLPPGLSLRNWGGGADIEGVPVQAGSYRFTITATDSSPPPGGPFSRSVEYTLDILPSSGLTILTDPALLSGTQGSPFTGRMFAVGGVSPHHFRIVQGRLPDGLSLGDDGTLTGTPNEAGNFVVTVEATDSTAGTPLTTLAQVPIHVVGVPLSFGPDALPQGQSQKPYSQRFVGVGGRPPYAFRIDAGALPAGLSLYGATIEGTPNVAGTFPITVTMSDAAGATVSRDYTLQVALAPLRHDEVILPEAIVGQSYAFALSGIAQGGLRPYRFEVVGGLPAGLQMNADGYISGRVQETGRFTLEVDVYNSGESSPAARWSFDLRARQASVTIRYPERPAPAVIGRQYASVVGAVGGQPPYRYTLSAGQLPPGLTIDAYGVIQGIPTAVGRYDATITATDSTTSPAAATGSREFAFVVEPSQLLLQPDVFADGRQGVAYDITLQVSNGVAPYRFSITAGALPPGLTLSGDGRISGTPGASPQQEGLHTYGFTIGATDAEGRTGAWPTGITVEHLAIVPSSIPTAIYGQTYRIDFVAVNGTPPVAWSLKQSTLPAGVTFDPATATLAGTPAAMGLYGFVIDVTDADHRRTEQAYTLLVSTQALSLDVANVPDAAVGRPYATTIAAAGGVPPYRIALSGDGGALPPGLSMDADGRITGLPTIAGTYTFTVVLSDSASPASATLQREYRIVVAAATGRPPSTTASRTLDTQSGIEASTTLLAGGGAATSATLVSVSPASAGAARIERVGDDYRLRFLPSSTFSGLAEVAYTLANAAGTSAPATITFRVAARPEPLRDARVKRLLDRQARSARRFADAQMENFRQRLERLHDAREARGFANGLRANATPVCVREVGAPPDRVCTRPPVAYDDDAAAPRASAPEPLFALWTAGTLRSANQDGRSPGGAFETDGVSLGADYRVDGRFAFGAGVGYARDGDMIEDSDRVASSRGEALAFATYASWRPGAHGFVDVLAGWQRLSFDLRRGDAAEGTTTRGRRDGLQRFASLSVGVDYAHADWRFAPYARVDASRATLDAYAESGGALQALGYAPLSVNASSANAGLRIDYRCNTRFGVFAPQLRVEYQRDLDAGAAQWLDYADVGIDPRYRSTLSAYDRSRWLLGFGLRFDAARRWSFGLDTRWVGGNGGGSDRTLQLRVEKRF